MDIKTIQDLKAKNEDAILLFRVGDFYEIYDADASIASSIIGIDMTKDADSGINKVNFPNLILDRCLMRLKKAGKRVAIVEEAKSNAAEKTQKSVSSSELAKIKRENKELKECITELAMERDKALARAQDNVHEVCCRLVTLGGLPKEAYEIIHEYIGIKELVKTKIENKIAPSLDEIQTLLDKINELEKED